MAKLTGRINFIGGKDALLNVGKSKTLTMSLKLLPPGIAAGSIIEFEHDGLVCSKDSKTGILSKYIQAKAISIVAIKESTWVVEDYTEEDVADDEEVPFD
jgi:hypothetical protein